MDTPNLDSRWVDLRGGMTSMHPEVHGEVLVVATCHL